MSEIVAGNWCYGVICTGCGEGNGIFEAVRVKSDPTKVLLNGNFTMMCARCNHHDTYDGTEIQLLRTTCIHGADG